MTAAWENGGAAHIRGRITSRLVRSPHSYKRGGWSYYYTHRMRLVWRLEVINTKTDTVINADGPFPTLQAAYADVAERVAAARSAWSMGLRRKDLR